MIIQDRSIRPLQRVNVEGSNNTVIVSIGNMVACMIYLQIILAHKPPTVVLHCTTTE